MPRGMHGNSQEKSKDFVGAMKRLFKELKNFRVLIYVALVLASISAILSIVAPSKLSSMTDEITNGLIVNRENMEEIQQVIGSRISDITPDKILLDNEITKDEKEEFMKVMGKIDIHNQKELIEGITSLSQNVLNKMFPEITIDGQKISSLDQVQYIKIMGSFDEDTSKEELYKSIEEMPESIQKVIKPYMNIDKIKSITIFLIVLYVVSALFSFIESIIMTDVSNNFARDLRNRISVKINKLPLKYFDNKQNGDILSRVTNDVDMIAQTMNNSLSTLVSSITLLVGTIIMMFVTNYIMAITAILASLIGFAFMIIILAKSQKYFTLRQTELGNLNSHIEETYSGLLVVKAYNGKEEVDKKFDICNEKVFNANRKSQFLSGLMMPIMSFIGNFGYVMVCIIGALLVQKDMITFGVIVAFITYVRLFTSPLSQIAQAMTSLQSTAAASERVFEFVDEEEMLLEDNITKVLDKKKAKGNIIFKNVNFGYDNKKMIIKDFNVKVRSGQKVAIVGPTGAGKTTLVNLLMKFYDINSGDILIDGISIKELSRENIHSLFTMVLQDTWLFNGTLKENIIYNRVGVNDKRIKKICDDIGVTHFINTLPEGIDTLVTESDSISAGQKQLITIARGMVEDAPFLILDEATSNVDTRTEELVQQAMDKLTKGKTSFIIAHRLSTIKNADIILVMRDGNIVEMGNHQELMDKKGFYADLYNSQFEL